MMSCSRNKIMSSITCMRGTVMCSRVNNLVVCFIYIMKQTSDLLVEKFEAELRACQYSCVISFDNSHPDFNRTIILYQPGFQIKISNPSSYSVPEALWRSARLQELQSLFALSLPICSHLYPHSPYCIHQHPVWHAITSQHESQSMTSRFFGIKGQTNYQIASAIKNIFCTWLCSMHFDTFLHQVSSGHWLVHNKETRSSCCTWIYLEVNKQFP